MDVKSRRYLYRLALFSAIAAVVFSLGTPALAQAAKKERGPRAIAVIRWSPDASGKAIPKLVPVTILTGERFYPADVYLANPTPLALEPGTIYEARDEGEILGLFTIKNASQSPQGWFAVGGWQGRAPELHIQPGVTSTARMVTDNPPPQPNVANSGDEGDTNHKTVTVYDEEGHPLPPDQADAATRPTDKRDTTGGYHPAQSSKPPGKPAAKDDDPDRPTIRRGSPGGTQAQSSQTATAESVPPGLASADADPNRPMIHRGKPVKEGEGAASGAGIPVPIRVLQKSPYVDKGGAKVFEAVAVSDANPQDEAESYRFSWSDDERQSVQEKLLKIAAAELERFAQKHPYAGLTPAQPVKAVRGKKSKAAKPPTPELEVVRTEALDLDHSNDPVVYFAARSQSEGAPAFVAIVARLDINGDPRPIYKEVTTERRLDVAPHLELVDAVDADGDGRGELLFRSISDRHSEYAIYKVGIDSMELLFRGGDAD